MTFSNDGATIMSLCPWRQAACRLLRDVALSQDEKCGDGTTSVVLLACELVRCMTDLRLEMGGNVDVEVVLRGLMIAERYCTDCIRRELQVKADDAIVVSHGNQHHHSLLMQLARSSLQSKLVRSDIEFFASMVVDCVKECFKSHTNEEDGEAGEAGDGEVDATLLQDHDGMDMMHFSSRINVIRAIGNRMQDSFVFRRGYMMEHPIDNVIRQQRSLNELGNSATLSMHLCRVCLLDFELSTEWISRHTFARVEIEDINALSTIAETFGESSGVPKRSSLSQKMWQTVEKSGASVVFMSTRFPIESFLPDRDIVVVDRVSRESMYRIAAVTGGTVLRSTLGLNENQVSMSLGTARLVEQCHLGQKSVIGISSISASCPYSTIIVRGSSDSITAEVERVCESAFCFL